MIGSHYFFGRWSLDFFINKGGSDSVFQDRYFSTVCEPSEPNIACKTLVGTTKSRP